MTFVLGDLAYQPGQETAYCRHGHRPGRPARRPPGRQSHADDLTRDGLLRNFVRCLPDRLAVAGTYAKNYVVDRGAVRFIMIAPGILIDGARRTYADGTASQAWLRDRIRAGRASGRWVVVGMHMPCCFTLGAHGCASSPDLTDALIEERVDLSLAGTRPQLHPLAPAARHRRRTDGSPTATAPTPQGAGTVFAIVGNGRGTPRARSAPRTSLWAAASGYQQPRRHHLRLRAGLGHLHLADLPPRAHLGRDAGRLLHHQALTRTCLRAAGAGPRRCGRRRGVTTCRRGGSSSGMSQPLDQGEGSQEGSGALGVEVERDVEDRARSGSAPRRER